MLSIDLDPQSKRWFDRNIRGYLAQTKRDWADATNDFGFELAGGYGNARPGALQLTARADRTEIQRQLSAEVTTVTTKSGKVRTKASFGTVDDARKTLAAHIINARLADKGKQPVWGRELKKKAQELVAARVRSIGYTAAMWFAAIRVLAPFVKRRGSVSGPVKADNPTGGAIPAQPGNSPSCTIIWDAKPKHPNPGIEAVAAEGLRRAIIRFGRGKEEYLRKKMDQTARKFSDR